MIEQFNENKKVVTYVELGSMGHQAVWMLGIVEAFMELGSKWTLNLWVSNEFQKCHRDVCSHINDFVGAKKAEVNLKSYEKLLQGDARLIKPIEVVQRCTEVDRPDVCFLALNLDACVRDIIFSKRGSFGTRLVGISSQPFLHYVNFISSKTKKWLFSKRYLSSLVKTFFLCRRKDVAEILMLDPFAPDFYNSLYSSNKFRYLPEYFDDTIPLIDVHKHFGLPRDKTLFVFPGNISRRKGVLEFLDALLITVKKSSEFAESVSVVLAGPVMSDVRDPVFQRVDMLKRDFPDFQLFLFDRFLKEQEFISLISVSDIVCLLYLKFAGSSNILIHAASYGRLILSPEFGLIGELVERYQLGITCDESDINSLSKALLTCWATSSQVTVERRHEIQSFAKKYSTSLHRFGENVCASFIKAVGNR